MTIYNVVSCAGSLQNDQNNEITFEPITCDSYKSYAEAFQTVIDMYQYEFDVLCKNGHKILSSTFTNSSTDGKAYARIIYERETYHDIRAKDYRILTSDLRGVKDE